ncbi:hypothetical protein DUI87_03604 [Hirundo rustica rustica]|uniref:Uncharacterized protein n=1 Tax=Hirundo rustica rustica TaxID=333673 RepID=A0A3M0L0S2_HIRRU|nr:hypothetical protein DUI87_03604 [Hirundo rustica rustica]
MPWSVAADAKDTNGDPFEESSISFQPPRRTAEPADEGSAEKQLGLAQAEGSVEQSYPAVAVGQSGEGAPEAEGRGPACLPDTGLGSSITVPGSEPGTLAEKEDWEYDIDKEQYEMSEDDDEESNVL